MGKSKKARFEICPNCSQTLNNDWEYCPVCGQSVYQVQGSLKYLFNEISGNMYSFDWKLFRTIGRLFAKPGIVASEYVSGKMASYVPPVRLFIFVSLMLFVALSVSTCTNKDKEHLVGINGNYTFKDKTLSKELSNNILNASDHQLDSLLIETKTKPTYFNRIFLQRIAKITLYGIDSLYEEIKGNAMLGMFLLMPLSALILLIFYRKKRNLYFDHLIATLYIHTAIFLLFILNELTVILFDFDWFLGTLVIFYIYFVWSLRNFYNTKWKSAIWLSIPIIGTYFIFFFLFITVVTFTSFLTF